jgi:hypothetical protein
VIPELRDFLIPNFHNFLIIDFRDFLIPDFLIPEFRENYIS